MKHFFLILILFCLTLPLVADEKPSFDQKLAALEKQLRALGFSEKEIRETVSIAHIKNVLKLEQEIAALLSKPNEFPDGKPHEEEVVINDFPVKEAINKQHKIFYNGGSSPMKLTSEELAKITKLDLGFFKKTPKEIITDAGLKDVAKLKNLKSLDLGGTRITDLGLKDVAKLQKLEDLDLSSTKITTAGLREVAKLKNLTSLDLMHNLRINDASMKEVAKMQQLTSLTFGYTRVTNRGLDEVAKLKRLTWCQFYNTDTGFGAAWLSDRLPLARVTGPTTDIYRFGRRLKD
jgi:hypothetical protein